MDDTQVLHNIDSLVKEEHELMNQAENGGLSEEQHARMKEIEVSLDRCWDLLRQRRARREFGLNPEEAKERPASITRFISPGLIHYVVTNRYMASRIPIRAAMAVNMIANSAPGW